MRKKEKEKCAWCTPDKYLVNQDGTIPLCKAHGKMIYESNNKTKTGV